MTRGVPTKEQTLAALARVSRGEVWHHTPQPETWRPIGDLAAELVFQQCEAPK